MLLLAGIAVGGLFGLPYLSYNLWHAEQRRKQLRVIKLAACAWGRLAGDEPGIVARK